jgi:predicted enzyme related to lactoylglutathione lyase
MAEHTAKTGKPIWIDLSTTDLDGAKSFYRSLFGWDVEELGPEAQGYAYFNLNGQMVGGVGPTQGGPEQPAAWMSYIATEDMDATLAAVKENGGDSLFEPLDLFDLGRGGAFRDHAGAVLGLWEPKQLSGFRVQDQPGSFTWFELNTPDVDTAKLFYAAIFGWDTKTSEGDQPYTEWQVDGKSIGGATGPWPNAPADAPPSWLLYLATDDVDKTSSKAQELGGKTLVPPLDYPGGRFAMIQDPQGAVFGVVKSQQQ